MTVTARHYARLGAVQFLYSWDVQNQSVNQADDQILIDSNVLLNGDLVYFQKLLKSIPPKISQLDEIISKVVHWKIDTIDPVVRAILRLGVYEMTCEYDVPLKVITNECIELSREFGNPDSYKFINGTLDKLAFSEHVRLSKLIKRGSQSYSREFELIQRYFADRQSYDESVLTGIGDDCAIVDIPADQQLLVTTDTLHENVHFPASTKARQIGYKSLAVSLSDLASKGAKPKYAMLNLSLPGYDTTWLAEFSRGFFDLAAQYNIGLIGGDTVRGPLSIGITAFGMATVDQCPLRSGARPGDAVHVTGTLGDAALGLIASRLGNSLNRKDAEFLQRRLELPQPRVKAGQVIARYATSSIDLSDGLIADLSHILVASGVGASIDLEKIPLSPVYQHLLKDVGWDYALAHGDDYELCFTISQELPESAIEEAAVPMSRIGTVVEGDGIEVRQPNGEIYQIQSSGYSHF
ncbi:MAG: thiamine-phosphate kinase [Gammaproteobacteria bacterium]|nr:thiamine-phosphate kinase [Gammaproteobacteria bacterium]